MSPTFHYHWQQSARREGFVIRYAFIKEIYYDYMAYCSEAAGVSQLRVVDGILYYQGPQRGEEKTAGKDRNLE